MRDCVLNQNVFQLKDPHPNPLGETTSHSTKLQNPAAKSLVIPPAGEGISLNRNHLLLIEKWNQVLINASDSDGQ